MNRVTLMGIVGRDPKIHTFSNGNRSAGFSLATTERRKEKAVEKKEKTERHHIKVYGGLVDVVDSYVKKGTKLFLEGKIATIKYEKDGAEKTMVEIQLQGPQAILTLLGGKTGDKPADKPKSDSRDMDSGDTKIDDDIPF